MGNFQFMSGGTWYDVPDAAHPSDEGGEIALVRPEPQAVDGLGLPCGAIGRPRVVIRSKLMRGDGWNWYQAFFPNQDALSATITGITAYDPRAGGWKKCTGTLFRPTGKCSRPGTAATNTLYEDVEIIVDGVTETT